MSSTFSFSQLRDRYPTDDACLEEIKRLRFPNGIKCVLCRKVTTHYKLRDRTAYACKFCRTHVYPLAGTIFEKTTTPLRLWFYAVFLMTQTRAGISARQLQRELGVTYKTAWRIHDSIYYLLDKEGLLHGEIIMADVPDTADETASKVRRWLFFNTLEFKVVQKHATPSDEVND